MGAAVGVCWQLGWPVRGGEHPPGGWRGRRYLTLDGQNNPGTVSQYTQRRGGQSALAC
jgi:hypothetical protein